MKCPTPCPPCFGTPCPHFQSTSEDASSSTYKTEHQPTIWPTGFVGLGIPYQPRRSSGTERALKLLDEAWEQVKDMDNSRERSIALTKIEEAEMWLKRIND